MGFLARSDSQKAKTCKSRGFANHPKTEDMGRESLILSLSFLHVSFDPSSSLAINSATQTLAVWLPRAGSEGHDLSSAVTNDPIAPSPPLRLLLSSQIMRSLWPPLPLLLIVLAPGLSPGAAQDSSSQSTVSVYVPGYGAKNWEDLAGSVITSVC